MVAVFLSVTYILLSYLIVVFKYILLCTMHLGTTVVHC